MDLQYFAYPCYYGHVRVVVCQAFVVSVSPQGDSSNSSSSSFSLYDRVVNVCHGGLVPQFTTTTQFAFTRSTFPPFGIHQQANKKKKKKKKKRAVCHDVPVVPHSIFLRSKKSFNFLPQHTPPLTHSLLNHTVNPYPYPYYY